MYVSVKIVTFDNEVFFWLYIFFSLNFMKSSQFKQKMANNDSPSLFTAADYAVCIVMLVASFALGLVAAFIERRHRSRHRITSERFLLGSRRLNVIPVSMSMTIPFAAAINILGTPADVYMYNTMFWWICLAYIIGGALVCRMFVPLYFKTGVVSAFEVRQIEKLYFYKKITKQWLYCYTCQLSYVC